MPLKLKYILRLKKKTQLSRNETTGLKMDVHIARRLYLSGHTN